MMSAKSRRCLQARIDLHHTFLFQRADAAQGQFLVFAAQRGGDLVGAHAQRFHRGGPQVDLDLAFHAADHGDRAHTAHVFHALLQHLRGPGGQVLRAGVAARCGQHGDVEDGLRRRVEAQDARVLDLVAQQRADLRDLFAHVVGGLAAVDLEVELDDDDRAAFIAA
jgi:hypothetical protein